MKKNKKRNKFDLGKVSGGLSVGGNVAAKGSINAIDKREVFDLKDDKRNIKTEDTSVGISLNANIK